MLFVFVLFLFLFFNFVRRVWVFFFLSQFSRLRRPTILVENFWQPWHYRIFHMDGLDATLYGIRRLQRELCYFVELGRFGIKRSRNNSEPIFGTNMARLLFSEVKFCLLSLFIVSSFQFELTILHTNDVHARFEQFDKYTIKCDDLDAREGKCFGGVARRATLIKQIRAEVDNVLLLDGGDQFQGTNWYYVHRGKAAAHFANKLGYDVMVSL